MDAKKALLTVRRDSIQVQGLWPGWHTAVGIIVFIAPETRRRPNLSLDCPQAAADRIGERIRALAESHSRASGEEFYEVLHEFRLLPQEFSTEHGLPAFTDVATGRELWDRLQLEALQQWSAAPSRIRCGSYLLRKTNLSRRQQLNLEKMNDKVARYKRKLDAAGQDPGIEDLR